ncbi:MAG: zinc ABC transporter substrate-binding protein [Propionibacteriaceae bacterium]|nr:zinc ABC transporter substrate-binding protein [Propionibacteriaceae bacterium]
MAFTKRVLCGFAGLATALALTGCAGGGSTPSSDSDGLAHIVASTNVYGDIATAIAGDRADVVSFINSPSQDPHEYEASAQDRLAVEDADIVIENGAGYDHFVDLLLDGAESQPVVLTAVVAADLVPEAEAHGEAEIEGFNEHVWYSFDAMEALAQQLATALADVDPQGADAYTANYQAFAAQLAELESAATQLQASAQGKGVAITEPVPLYLLEAVGLVNQTPEEFSEAVEEGEDVPPRALQETLDLFGSGQVALLAYNEQTADNTTEQVRAAAQTAGIPVVDFTETLPEGQTYIEWQRANLANLEAALS